MTFTLAVMPGSFSRERNEFCVPEERWKKVKSGEQFICSPLRYGRETAYKFSDTSP